MPNYTTNILLIEPNKLKPFCKRGKFSLDKIKPQPKIFNKARFDISPVLIKTTEEIKETNEGITQEESDKLIKKYGFDNWYDWNCHNWGTKWDVCDFNSHNSCVSFTTAWSSPIEALKSLCEQLQEDFEVIVKNEGEEAICLHSYWFERENKEAYYYTDEIGNIIYNDKSDEDNLTLYDEYKQYQHYCELI